MSFVATQLRLGLGLIEVLPFDSKSENRDRAAKEVELGLGLELCSYWKCWGGGVSDRSCDTVVFWLAVAPRY